MAARRRAALVASMALLALTGLTACEDDQTGSIGSAGSSSSPPVSAETEQQRRTGDGSLPDACALLTKQEAGDLVGAPVTTVQPDDKEDEKGCNYGDNLSLYVSGTTPDDFESEAEGYRKAPGIGDSAYHLSGVLWIRHGNVKVVVIAGGGDDGRAAIGRKVVEKLDAGA